MLSYHFRQRLLSRFICSSGLVKAIVVIFFSFAFFADVLGMFPYKAIPLYFYFFGLCFLTLAFSLERPSAISFRLFSWIIGLCFFSVFIGHTVATFYGEGSTIFMILSYVNPRFLNQVQVWLIIPSLYIALVSKQRMAYLFPVLNFAMMFALDARGLAIASFGGVVLWMMIEKHQRWHIAKTTIISLVIGLMVAVIFLTPLPSYLVHGDLSRSLLDMRDTTNGRLLVWRNAIEMSQFWGLGGDGYICTSILEIRPHNSVLSVLLNWGAVPAICYLALVFILLKQVVFERSRRYRIIGLSLLSGLALSLVSAVLDSPFSLLLACLFTGWFCGRTQCATAKGYPLWRHGLLIVTSMLVVTSIAYKVTDRVKNDFYLAQVGEVLVPQFWLGNNCPDIRHVQTTPVNPAELQ
ncbi:O-antigen ligase family protein [Vibrio ezurae]|nr:O-antigen ligase family protein [Vibrio ezurae]